MFIEMFHYSHQDDADKEKFFKDNWCMCNIAAFRKTTRIPNEDILFASFDNSVSSESKY